MGITTLQNERGCPLSRLGVDMVSFWVFKKEIAIFLSISLRVFRIEVSIYQTNFAILCWSMFNLEI